MTARVGAPRGLGRPNCSPHPLVAEPVLPGQTVAKLFGTYLPEPPGVDFELPNRPSDPQKHCFSMES